jgi:hypothetical protein
MSKLMAERMSGVARASLCAALCALAFGCGAKSEDDGDGDQPVAGAGNAGTSAAGSGSNAGDGSSSAGDSAAGAGSAGMGSNAGTGSSGNAGSAGANIDPDDITPPPPEVIEMLDPDTDWEALTIVYPTMYSAYDGVHTFQVPAHIDGTTIPLEGWEAIPSDAAIFEEDPEVEGGVLITVQAAVKQITIAASDSGIGGTAALFVTDGTEEQWIAGEGRYANGVEFDLNLMIDFTSLLDPNWSPPEPPPNLACNNCHTTGAKYFEIQHTPTQIARYSDEDLRKILKEGTKPPGRYTAQRPSGKQLMAPM